MESKQNARAAARRADRNERNRERTRSEILDAARDVVLRDGVTGFTIAAVAKKLGLTKPALYYYFASKEALIFDLILREFLECASAVQAAVEATDTGVDAVEQLMRTVFERYRSRLDLFMLAYKMVPATELATRIGPDELARIRPTNEMFYGGAEARVRADQRRGKFRKKRDPRRFAFTAHMAVIGLLNMKAMTESSDDPLLHSDDALIDDICRTFRDAGLPGGGK